jgi:hypothetical protein
MIAGEYGEQEARVQMLKDGVPDGVGRGDKADPNGNGPLQGFEGKSVIIVDQQENAKDNHRRDFKIAVQSKRVNREAVWLSPGIDGSMQEEKRRKAGESAPNEPPNPTITGQLEAAQFRDGQTTHSCIY